MNEELYHLLDGDLPDEASVEMFRSLADSREQRELFREQVRLQGALYRNDSYGAMSADEETEMLGRMGDAIGMNPPGSPPGAVPSGNPPPRAGRRFAPLALALLGIGLLLGGGAGYLAGGGFDNPQQEAVSTPPVPVQQAPALETAPSEAPMAFNHDSVVAAIRDSLTQAMSTSQAQNAAKRKVRSPRRPAGDNDPTGAAAARRLAKEKEAKQKSN